MAQSKREFENLIIMNSHDSYDYEYYNLIQSNDERRRHKAAKWNNPANTMQ